VLLATLGAQVALAIHDRLLLAFQRSVELGAI
jgi:hypothetical protein